MRDMKAVSAGRGKRRVQQSNRPTVQLHGAGILLVTVRQGRSGSPPLPFLCKSAVLPSHRPLDGQVQSVEADVCRRFKVPRDDGSNAFERDLEMRDNHVDKGTFLVPARSTNPGRCQRCSRHRSGACHPPASGLRVQPRPRRSRPAVGWRKAGHQADPHAAA